MNKNNSQLSRPKRIISLIIVILPIINQYKFGYLTFLELFSLVISFYYICQYRKIRFYTFNSFFYIYLLYSVLFGLLSVLRFNEFSFFIIVSRYVKLIIIYFTFITVIPKLINLNYFVKLYKRISLILTSLVFFQSSIFNLLKKPIYLLIPNTLLNYNGVIKSNELINHNIFLSLNGYLFRPSSVFIEPSHYSLYILPCLVLCLFYKVKEDNTNINFKLTIFLTIGALLTTSMLSILGVILIWLFFFVSSWKKNIRINDIIKGFLVLSILVLAFILLGHNYAFSSIIDIKLKSVINILFDENLASNSTTLRMFRGIIYYSNIDFISKIFGVGFGNITKYYYEFDIKTFVDPTNLFQVSYMNSLSTVLVSTGLVGLLLYLFSLYRVYVERDICVKALILITFYFILFSSSFERPIYYITLSLTFSIIIERKKVNQSLTELNTRRG